MDNSACGGDGTPPPTGGCGSPQWANDQWCDDENNNEGCNWDGGACCNNDFDGYTEYCTACECLDPNNGGPTTTTTTTTTTTEPPTTAPPNDCEPQNWNGDNYCDDVLNFEECGWDGGDCCGDDVNTQYCEACECLDPNGGGNPTTQGPTSGPTTQGPTSGPTTQGPTVAPPSPNSCGKINIQKSNYLLKHLTFFHKQNT